MLTRRELFERGGQAVAAAALAPLGRALVRVRPAPSLLVAVVLRGGADGLGMVVPYGDAAYSRVRPTTAIAPPGRRGGALDLDGRFGLHPRLAPLLPFYRERSLTVVHACGLAGGTRSHLVEQDRLERMLGRIAVQRDPAHEARHVDRAATAAVSSATPGVEYPASPLGRSLQRIAAQARRGGGVCTAIAYSPGWDHHTTQGGADGALAARLDDLARGLSAFARDLGDRMEQTLVVTLSEFGRTVAENADGGTGHGRATAMLVMGGGIDRGRVDTDWPGLDRDALDEHGGIPVTCDVRDVLDDLLGVARPWQSRTPALVGAPCRRDRAWSRSSVLLLQRA